MKRHAILIGVEEYTHFPKTPFAHADVDLLAETLTQYCDYAEQHTSIFKLSPASPLPPAEILNKIRDAVSVLDSQDTVLLYFAGHGHLAEGEGFLVLPDTQPQQFQTTALPLSDLTKELRREHRVCFRIFDACHSGLDVRRAETDLDPQGFIRSVTTGAAAGWVTLAACKEDESSIGDPELNQGIFTYYLSEYIRKLEPDAHVLPEFVRLAITEQVSQRASALHHVQTPTLNASISGVVSLATRKVPDKPENGEGAGPSESLTSRIAQIRALPDIVQATSLDAMLAELSEATLHELEKRSDFLGEIKVGSPIPADDIPEGMHKSLIEFTRNQGFRPRHRHDRNVHVSTEDYPWSSLALVLPRRTHREVDYALSQPSDLPKSAVLYDTSGDGRCVPPLGLLVYVIPLQISVCLLVAGFRKGWPPDEAKLIHLKHCYQHQRPDAPDGKKPQRLAPFALEQIMDEVNKVVERRVQQLDRELET